MTRWMQGAAVVAMVAVMTPAGVSAQGNAQGGGSMKDIVGVAIEAGNFKTLVAAVQAAGLVEVLQGTGPFTVFAPTDAAFEKLPAGTVEALLADPEALRSVLTYHVVAGRIPAEILRAGSVTPTSVQGQKLTVRVENGSVRVDGAKVIAPDVRASNGVIHVIDTVILPKKAPAEPVAR